MATLGAPYLTLADALKRNPESEREGVIIELLSQTNEILQDAVGVEANEGATHLTTVRTGIPAGTWRKLYKGVPYEKSTTVQVRDACGMLESFSRIDKDLVEKHRNRNAFRLQEGAAFLEGLNQTFATTFIYGDTGTEPERFMGLAPRYSSLSADPADSGYNVIDAGGEGADNTSVWFVKWGDITTHLVYPQGSKAGLQHNDVGEETVHDGDGNPYRAYVDHFKWDVGLTVRDWRSVARVANVDMAGLAAGTTKLEDFMIEAFYRVRKRPGSLAVYCNEQVLVALHKRAKDQANVNLSVDTFEGKEIVRFLGAPLRQVDAILTTEAAVS